MQFEFRIQERAALGAQYMDTVVPGWYRKNRIDIFSLDMSDERRCILGQTHGSFSRGKEQIFLTNEDAEQFGFLVLDETTNSIFVYEMLRLAWIDEIHKRRTADRFKRQRSDRWSLASLLPGRILRPVLF